MKLKGVSLKVEAILMYIIWLIFEDDSVDTSLPRWLSGKRPAYNAGRRGFHPWVRKILWRRKWQPATVFLPEKTPWTEEPGGL